MTVKKKQMSKTHCIDDDHTPGSQLKIGTWYVKQRACGKPKSELSSMSKHQPGKRDAF